MIAIDKSTETNKCGIFSIHNSSGGCRHYKQGQLSQSCLSRKYCENKTNTGRGPVTDCTCVTRYLGW